MTASVAVIGVGVMGAPVAGRLLEAGFAVTVCDKSSSALLPFTGQGVVSTTRPAECAGADVVILLVATAEQAHEALFGDDGVTSALKSGPGPLVLVMSTMSKDAVVDIATAGRRRGLAVLDAPVSGGVPRAAAGTLTVLLGGESADIERARSVLDAVSEDVFHCGPVGTAQVAKLVNNVVCAATLAVAGEAYALGLAHGLDLRTLTQILEVSSGRSFLSGAAEEVVTYFRTWTGSQESYDNALRTLRKDLRLALDLSTDGTESHPGIEGVAAVYERLGDETFRRWEVVADALGDRAGLT